MTQTGRNPHGYNPMNYQRHYQWARSCLLCQLDSSHLFINVSNRTRSTRLQSHELSTPLTLGALSCLLCQMDSSHLLINVSNRTRSQLVCFYENIITLNTVIKAEFLYQLTYISLVYIRFGYLRA